MEEIPSVGNYKPIQVADESLILVRDKSDKIKALINVCKHRGTQLCTEPTGHSNLNLYMPISYLDLCLRWEVISCSIDERRPWFSKG